MPGDKLGKMTSNPKIPRSLASVLGVDIVAETICSFVDYMENTISVHEADGKLVGGKQVGNGYCRLLMSLDAPYRTGRNENQNINRGVCTDFTCGAAIAAIRSGCSSETRCPGGFLLYAAPIISSDEVLIGTCLGAVSDTPSSANELEDVAVKYAVDTWQLKKVADRAYHKPQYLYDAGRNHIERLAKTLAQLYDNALEKESVIERISERERELHERNQFITLTQSITTSSISELGSGRPLTRLTREVVEKLGYRVCNIFMLSEDGGGLQIVAGWGAGGSLEERRRRSVVNRLDDPGFQKAPYAITYHTGEQTYMADATRFEEFPHMAVIAREKGFRSMLCTPLDHYGERLGVIAVYTPEVHDFSSGERDMMTAVAGQIASVVAGATVYSRLKRSEERYRQLFDGAADWIYTLSEDGVILDCNQTMMKALELGRGELVGHHIYDFQVDADRLKAIKDIKDTTARDAESFRAERKFKGPGGELLTVQIHARALRQKDEARTRWQVVARDVTEEGHLREQLSQSERMRSLGEMAGGVAHDFNNYLTVILGHVQWLRSQNVGDNGEFSKSLAAIERASSDAAETVRRIQEFTRVRTVRKFCSIDVNEVIRNVVEVSRPRWRDEAEARNTPIEVILQLKDVPPVNANESELGEVLMNLILNAADALPEGGRMEISSRIDGEKVLIEVADNGVGMSETVMKRIFDPFFTTKGSEGVGLGLSVTYGIVTRHGGEVSVESNVGNGSIFTITLPVAAISNLEEEIESVPELANGACAKILVIDDMETIRSLLTAVLEKMGHKVQTAGNGRKGLDLFRDSISSADGSFDMVMTDLGMPGLCGWEVAEEVKKMSPETPVVLFTGWGDQLDRKRMKDDLVDAVLAKPFETKDIMQLMAKALTMRQKGAA